MWPTLVQPVGERVDAAAVFQASQTTMIPITSYQEARVVS